MKWVLKIRTQIGMILIINTVNVKTTVINQTTHIILFKIQKRRIILFTQIIQYKTMMNNKKNLRIKKAIKNKKTHTNKVYQI